MPRTEKPVLKPVTQGLKKLVLEKPTLDEVRVGAEKYLLASNGDRIVTSSTGGRIITSDS